MKKTVLLAALGLVVLGAIAISLYGAMAHPGFQVEANQQAELKGLSFAMGAQNFTCVPKPCQKWPIRGKGFKGFQVELSEGFKEKVLAIVKADEDVQKLLSEGYNVSDIRVAQVKLTVQENGQITMEASKALVMLTNGNGGKACVEVDLKARVVTKIVVVNIKVIKKGAST
ncbi:MAG: hypothetical protein QXS79_04410 [Candidatus Bathyarchaeia archaeon]